MRTVGASKFVLPTVVEKNDVEEHHVEELTNFTTEEVPNSPYRGLWVLIMGVLVFALAVNVGLLARLQDVLTRKTRKGKVSVM